MYNPKDLEGEVDHSFFDSDSEVAAGVYKGNTQGVRDSGPSWGGEEQGRASSQGSQSPSEGKEDHLPAKERIRSPSESGQSEDTRKNGTRVSSDTGSSAEEREDEDEGEDGYELSEEESDEEPAGRSLGGRSVPRRLSRKLRGSRSSSGSASSYSSSGSCSSEPESPLSRKPTSVPKCLPPPSPRCQSRSGPCTTGESDDTVTDVTPLSTPDISPVQSFDLSIGGGRKEGAGHLASQHLRVPEGSGPEGERTSSPGVGGAQAYSSSPTLTPSESVMSGVGGSSGQRAVDDAVDLNHLLKAFLSLEQPTDSSPHVEMPLGRARKNYSFSNEEVRRIDRENQRLLRELSRQTPRPGSSAAASGRGAASRLSHSALNRQREQRRIERENMAFLKRLEAVKPTAGLRRVEQLADYQRHAGYLGDPTHSAAQSRPPSSRSSAGSSSSRASRFARTRPESSVSSITPKEPRPAWS
ncbi:cilia- and flagella-associated protein 97 isoform X1 [Brienomyrus brachyistius]|uniref:cilia- and flagella-associated protein 97 isoform X1 n=1 Tax=Brienomyrus brachyistius TaxID=42636 RepID=UPI0020B2E2F8|nr:cilia- and flagella-associated protein 97 isoform X1 [Brienomyrus brachyistius]XP_048851960.1 cilia- and flagella-associated protein 97 isoform X1 [Brienomyrus brachyistius]